MTFTIQGREARCDGCRAVLPNTHREKSAHACPRTPALWLKVARQRAGKETR